MCIRDSLIRHQNAFSKAVLNADNEITAGMSGLVRGSLYRFSRKTVPENGAYLDENGFINIVVNGESQRIMQKDRIRLPGIHNVENYLAAISATIGEVDVNNIVSVAENFGGVEHRIELVRVLDGVRWYNDSRCV